MENRIKVAESNESNESNDSGINNAAGMKLDGDSRSEGQRTSDGRSGALMLATAKKMWNTIQETSQLDRLAKLIFIALATKYLFFIW